MCAFSGASDADLARVAGRLRVLTYAQLGAAGLSDEAIEHRVRQGRLQRLWRGIYLVGPGKPHPLSLAKGAALIRAPDGVISLFWAAYVWGFAPTPSLPVDLTVTGGSRKGRPGGVVVHLSRNLDSRDRSARRGIAVTTPARTLLDIAQHATTTELDRLVADAQVAKVVTERQLNDLLARAGRHKGAPKLRSLLRDHPGLTRAETERLLRRLLKEAGLPQPQTNVKLLGGRYEADFLFTDQKLIIEIDGFATHGTRRAFEQDRRRNAELTAVYSVMQVTWRQLTEEPMAVIARIAAALATR